METMLKSENYDNERILVKKRDNSKMFKEITIELVDFSLIRRLMRLSINLVLIFLVGFSIYDIRFGICLASLVFIFVLVRLNSTVTKISVMIVPSIGVQERVETALGGAKLNLYEFKHIKGILLNEHISWCEVTFYMCLIYNSVGNQDTNVNNESLKPLFLSIRPKHDALKLIYKELQPLIKESIHQ